MTQNYAIPVLYRVAQRSFDTRGARFSIECQVTFYRYLYIDIKTGS